MARPKKMAKAVKQGLAGEEASKKSVIQEGVEGGAEGKDAVRNDDPESSVKILYHGSCSKLTPRGVGDLEYEIGVDDGTGEACLRIVGNASSGAFSAKWVECWIR